MYSPCSTGPSSVRHRLIVTADDFGYSSERDRGIVECFNVGAVTGTTLLINGKAAEGACALAKEHGIPVGLHLNLTEGSPVCQDANTSLVDDKGFFLGKFGFRRALKDDKIKIDEVKREILAQLASFKELMQASPTHVDGHQHIQVLPGIAEIFAETLLESEIDLTRLPIQPSLDVCDWLAKPKMQFFQQLQEQAKEARAVFKTFGIRHPDSFFGLSTMGEHMTIDHLQDALIKAKKKCEPCKDGTSPFTLELMTHPGYCSAPGHGGCGQGPDGFAQSKDREHEMAILKSLEWKQVLATHDVDLCSFKVMS